MKTTSQKALKVLSIIVIVLAVLSLIAGVAALFFGGTFMATGAIGMEEGGEIVEDATLLAGGGLIAFMLGGFIVLAAIIDIIIGVLGLGVAKDGRRVKLYCGLCIAGLILCAISIISSIAGGTFTFFELFSPIVIAIALYFALDIKKALGK